MNTPEWFQDPRISGISQEKLSLLLSLAKQIEGRKTQKELMPILVGALASANRQNLKFTPEEFDLIFSIMKEGKNEEEQKKMDETLAKARKVFHPS
jgi:hypothetical protein